MADIEYRIDYDAQGLVTSQHIIELGTKDRVRFVTQPETVEYLGKSKWKLALQRDGNTQAKNPFKHDLENPYLVPLYSAAQWILVEHNGNGFHWDCGYVDEQNIFHKWPDHAQQTQPAPRAAYILRVHPQPPQVNSLPFPV
jgi:hypothetical protein